MMASTGSCLSSIITSSVLSMVIKSTLSRVILDMWGGAVGEFVVNIVVGSGTGICGSELLGCVVLIVGLLENMFHWPWLVVPMGFELMGLPQVSRSVSWTDMCSGGCMGVEDFKLMLYPVLVPGVHFSSLIPDIRQSLLIPLSPAFRCPVLVFVLLLSG